MNSRPIQAAVLRRQSHPIITSLPESRKALDVAMKFEIIQACENYNVCKSKVGRHYNLSLSTLFMILKKKKTKTKLICFKAIYRNLFDILL
jgi:hypothetical protein